VSPHFIIIDKMLAEEIREKGKTIIVIMSRLDMHDEET